MELVGKIVAKYRILASLGDGGMGNVYLAQHETLQRRAAIKVLHRRFLDESETVERFLNEARAANRIRHSGIVDIYDSGLDEDIGAYLVMEYLVGETLAARVARDALLPIVEVCQIICSVASVLEAAHEAGIVHRDLKPANIFITDERIKIVDFGIAKLFGDTASMVRTRTGELFGTPLYMSPEQCHGAKSVDHRTDIYSLGVIAYQLLCGRMPFEAEGFGELIAMHLAQAPPSLRQQRPELPAALEAVVLRALAKDPLARQQSMAELHEEMAVSTGDGPAAVDSLPPTVISPAQPPSAESSVETLDLGMSRGRRWLLLLLAVVIIGGAAAGTYLLSRDTPKRRCVAGDLADCQQQCKLGQQGSCLELARMYRSGNGVARSPQRAAAMLKKLCDLPLAEGCRLLGQLYARGEGVRQDEAQAAILLRRACEARSVGACAEAGQMYRDGKGVAQDVAVAATLLRRGCDGGDDRGCLLLGELYTDERHQDLKRARALLRRSCGRKLARACTMLAELFERKKGATADLSEAARLYQKGCSLGDAKACAAHKRATAMAAEARQHRRVGWVYLGEHLGDVWRKRYFEIAPGTRPASLVGKVLRSLRRSNIRSAPPDEAGALGRVIGGMLPDTKVRVLVVKRWQNTEFMWARVWTLPSQ